MLCESNDFQVKKPCAFPNMCSMISPIIAGSLHLLKSPEDCLIFPTRKVERSVFTVKVKYKCKPHLSCCHYYRCAMLCHAQPQNNQVSCFKNHNIGT